jgi:5-methylcytosine-specific restriction endonuclease McrA
MLQRAARGKTMKKKTAKALMRLLRSQEALHQGIYEVASLSKKQLRVAPFKAASRVAKKAPLGAFRFCRLDEVEFWAVFSTPHKNRNYYLTLYRRDSSSPFAELHKIERTDNGPALKWKYRPVKHDGKNKERKALFQKINGDTRFTMCLPAGTPQDGLSFIDDTFCLVETKLAADELIDAPELRGGREGKRQQRTHWIRERDSKVARDAKAARREAAGELACEVCGFDFQAIYGKHGDGYIEAHHKVPLSQVDGERETQIKDLALVCANCHRMLHRGSPWPSVEALKTLHSTRPTARVEDSVTAPTRIESQGLGDVPAGNSRSSVVEDTHGGTAAADGVPASEEPEQATVPAQQQETSAADEVSG